MTEAERASETVCRSNIRQKIGRVTHKIRVNELAVVTTFGLVEGSYIQNKFFNM